MLAGQKERKIEMKKWLTILLVGLLLITVFACPFAFGVASDTSECGYSQYPSLCTDTWLIEVQVTLNAGTPVPESTGEAE